MSSVETDIFPPIDQTGHISGQSTTPQRSRKDDPAALCAPREAVARLRLQSIGARERLTFDVGADRIEVGRFLTAGDRQELTRLLEGFVAGGVEGGGG